jgi:hypothetical protein
LSHRISGRSRTARVLVMLAGGAVAVVALTGLTVQAVRGNRTVSVQREARTIHNAALDNAFYHCIDVQARSLVPNGASVALLVPVSLAGLGDLVTLLKGAGSWAVFADPASSATVGLSLRNNVSGAGTCLGTQVIGTYHRSGHKVSVRVGSGANVAGKGPPPAPPL